MAIGLFVKKGGLPRKVHHAEIWGLRESKYDWLERNDVSTTPWTEIHPKSPSYFFVPRDDTVLDRYQRYPKITEIFPLNGVGMTTARDGFVIDFDRATLLNRLRRFKRAKYDDDDLHSFFEIQKKKGWSIRKAWEALQEVPDGELEKHILPVLYRPFDIRWIFYHDAVVRRTVKRVMQHMTRNNMGLVTTRQFKEEPGAFVTCNVMTHKTVSVYDINYLFPLYCYPQDLLDQVGKTPNLSAAVLRAALLLLSIHRRYK